MIPVAGRGGPNLFHSIAPFLPDAPDLVTVNGELSPYHVSTGTREEALKVENAIRIMAVAAVGDHQPSVSEHLDFSVRSLKAIDEILERTTLGTHDQGNTTVFVAELGAYLGVVMESETRTTEHPGRWHTSPTYYFSALRFRTRLKGTLETSPFALVAKRLADKEKEVPILHKYVGIMKVVQE